MKNENAITWKYTGITKPKSEHGGTIYNILMCAVYNGYPDEDLEWYYSVGTFRDGKFYDKDGKEYPAQYWALINTPYAWECDPPYNILASLQNKKSKDGLWTTDSDRNYATLEDAIAIAAAVHDRQLDKAGEPYILHPLRLMMRMTSTEAMITAILHDVVEDSSPEDKWTFARLREYGFSEKVVEAVDGVTSRSDDGESYDEFIERAASNPIAREVKIADLEDNMNLLRLREVGQKELDRLQKYHRSWLRLQDRMPAQ